MKVNFEDIYRHIGFLFYALATKDTGLLANDRLRLTDIVERNWRQKGNGDPGLNMHLVDCIHDGIRYAIVNSMSRDHAMSSFRDYYTIHPLPFSPELKKKIVGAAILISAEFPERSHNGQLKENLESLMHVKQVSD